MGTASDLRIVYHMHFVFVLLLYGVYGRCPVWQEKDALFSIRFRYGKRKDAPIKKQTCAHAKSRIREELGHTFAS